jgi:hypothetical protein
MTRMTVFRGLRNAGVALVAAIFLGFVALFARNCAGSVRYNGLPTMSDACLEIVGKRLLTESNATGLSRGFVDRKYLASLAVMPAGVRDYELWRYCAEHVVPIPLVPGSGPATTLTLNELSYAQVLAFIPWPAASGTGTPHACLLHQVVTFRGFDTVGMLLGVKPPAAAAGARSARDFFDIAQQLWEAANSDQRDTFNTVRGRFQRSDLFYCDTARGVVTLSGEQLDLMARTLAAEKKWSLEN